jgi:hypothetical protein
MVADVADPARMAVGANAICKLNSLPFDATGEVIKRDGTWRVHEFTWQMDAILFWNRFQRRWLCGDEFHYPGMPKGLPHIAAWDWAVDLDARTVRGGQAASKQAAIKAAERLIDGVMAPGKRRLTLVGPSRDGRT